MSELLMPTAYLAGNIMLLSAIKLYRMWRFPGKRIVGVEDEDRARALLSLVEDPDTTVDFVRSGAPNPEEDKSLEGGGMADFVEALDSASSDAVCPQPDRVDGVGRRAVRRPIREPYIAKLIAEVRAEFPPLKMTAANKMMVDRFVRDRMREHHVRPSHIVQIKPIVVAMAFIASEGDVTAARLMGTKVVVERQEAATSRWGYIQQSCFGLINRFVPGACFADK